MSAFASIARGLEEANSHAEGKRQGTRLHEFHLSDFDVSAIWARTGLSQAEFARSIGIAKDTLLNWEQGAGSRLARPMSDGL